MSLKCFVAVKGIVTGEASVDVAVVFGHRTRQLDAVRRQHVLLE